MEMPMDPTEQQPEDTEQTETSPIVPPEQGTMENVNLVPALMVAEKGKEFLESLGKLVCRRKEEDEKSCKGYFERMAEGLELYLSRDGNFTKGPAEGSPRPVHPTLAKIVNRIYPRVVSVVLQTEPVAIPTGDEDVDRALRVQQHISWEKRAKHPDWATTMADSISQWILFGSMFRSVGWDVLQKRKAIEYLSVRDVILPYWEKDSTPDLRLTPRISKLKRYHKHQIRRLAKKGEWLSNIEIFSKDGDKESRKASPWKPKSDDVIRDVVDEVQGTEYQMESNGECFELIEQHLWAELPVIPGWNEDKDLPRRIAAWVEPTTKTVLRLVIMEQEIRTERIRADNEARLAKAATAAWRVAALRAMENGQMPPPMPQSDIEPPEMEPVFSTIHYRFMPNPEGVYGLGAWAFVGPLNKAVNDLLGEDIVAQRLANMQGGVMSDELGMEKKAFKLKMGEFIHLEGTTNEGIQQGIRPFPFERPKGNLSQYIERLDTEAQSVMSSSDMQSGMAGPSHETATAAKQRAYMGSTAVTTSVELFLIPLSYEYRQYARLNSMFMNDTEYFFVTEFDQQTGQKRTKPQSVTKADYEVDYDITFDADIRLEVDPGIGQSAVDAYMLVANEPLAQQDPNIRLAAFKKALRALKAQDLASRLPDNIPPPPPPSPMGQDDETAGFMEERDHPVLPDDDDDDHLSRMELAETTGTTEHLTPTGRQMFERHKQAHKAQALRKVSAGGIAAAAPNAMGGVPNGTGPQGMAQ